MTWLEWPWTTSSNRLLLIPLIIYPRRHVIVELEYFWCQMWQIIKRSKCLGLFSTYLKELLAVSNSPPVRNPFFPHGFADKNCFPWVPWGFKDTMFSWFVYVKDKKGKKWNVGSVKLIQWKEGFFGLLFKFYNWIL